VKREDIKNVFDHIKPDPAAREKMLAHVLNRASKSKENTMLFFNFRKVIPALALVAIFVGGILTYNLKDSFLNHGLLGDGKPEAAQNDMIGGDSISGSEDMPAPLLNQFQINGKHYILMSDYVEEFGFPATINDEDIGAKIATIEKSPDQSLIDCEVFSYLPAGCEAVVAVKRNNEYVLFKFFTFESYINNQDEDAIEYLKLYGIEGPEDIAKIQFIAHTEKSRLEGSNKVTAEITDQHQIATFYNFYSVLQNSSDKYFEKLFGNNATSSREVEIDAGNNVVDPSMPIPPDYMDSSQNISTSAQSGDAGATMFDMGETPSTAGSVAPSQGSAGNALADPVTIRIYNQNGVYYESMYYRNIGFISRYEITAEFAAFLANYI